MPRRADADGMRGITRYEDLLARHVLPVGVFQQIEGGFRPERLIGTAFIVGKNTVVTCWHCVQNELPDGQVYALGMRRDVYTPRYEEVAQLHDLGRATGGIDLALARADIDVEPSLCLARAPISYGADAVTIGYPLPAGAGHSFESHARLLRGYVSRIVQYNDPRWTAARAYELDMPAPGGISGGPLIDLENFEVDGVVVGVQEFEERDMPGEVPRIHPFTIAYHIETLRGAAAPATDGQPLGEYLGRK